jgi:hypothetical protein
MKTALHKCIVAILVTIHIVFAQEPEPAVEPEPIAEPVEPAPAVEPVPIPFATIPKAAVAELAKMSVAQALGASSLPRGCLADFTSLLESGSFNMGNFMKELPPAVAKVKLQMKSPFGKPKDGDRTNVGLTVGCIKSLPESPAEIQSLLKDISLKAGLDFAVDAAVNAAEDYISTNIAKESDSGGGMLKIVMSAGLIAGGLGAVIYGVVQNSEVSSSVSDRNGKKAVDAEKSRNIGYGVGAGLLAGGLGVVIFF